VLKDRFAKLQTHIKRTLHECFAHHLEWSAIGNMRAIEKSVPRTLKSNLVDVLQLSYGDGVLACMYREAKPPAQ